MRALVAEQSARSALGRRIGVLTEVERVEVTKLAYASASKDWMKNALREDA